MIAPDDRKAFVDFRGTGELCYWRSKSGYEVDFIIDDSVAIEVKAKSNVEAGGTAVSGLCGRGRG